MAGYNRPQTALRREFHSISADIKEELRQSGKKDVEIYRLKQLLKKAKIKYE